MKDITDATGNSCYWYDFRSESESLKLAESLESYAEVMDKSNDC